MFVVSDPVHPRTKVENIFGALYGVGVLILFAALVITFDNYLYRVDQTYSTFSSGKDAILHPNLEVILANCTTSQTINIGGFDITAEMDETASPFAFLSHSLMIIGVIANLFLIVLNDLIAKGCFFANIRHIRLRGISMPINTICANAMLVQSIAMLILIAGSSSGRKFLDGYVRKCTQQFATNNFAEFIARENNVQNVFGINLDLCIIAVSINLAIYCGAFIALCIDGFSLPSKQFEDAKYFWEKPPSGAPIKKELFHYTQWRNFALECLANDVELEMRPVSYVEFMEDLEAAKAEYGDHQDHDDEDEMFDGEKQQSFYDEHFSEDRSGKNSSTGGGSRSNKSSKKNKDKNKNTDEDNFDNVVMMGDNNTTNNGVPFFPGQREELDIPEAFDPEDQDATDADFVMPDGEGDGDQLTNLPVPLVAPTRDGDGDDDNDADDYDDDEYDQDPSVLQQRRRSQSTASADRPYQQVLRKKANESEAERKERHRRRREMETPEERAARKERKRRIRELVSNTGNNNRGSDTSPNASRPTRSSGMAPPVPSP